MPRCGVGTRRCMCGRHGCWLNWHSAVVMAATCVGLANSPGLACWSWTTSYVRHEALCIRVGREAHPWPPQRLGEAEGSLPWELPWWAGAALTTYRDGGTTRRRGRASKVGRCNASEPVAEPPQFVDGSKPG